MSELKQALVNEIVSRIRLINAKSSAVAKEFDVLPSDVSQLLSGKAMVVFTLDKVQKIAAAFGIGFSFAIEAKSIEEARRMVRIGGKNKKEAATVGPVDFDRFEDE